MRPTHRAAAWRCGLAVIAATLACTATAQANDGGLYIAGEGFSFRVAAERALANNAGDRRFFLLTLPSEAAALRRNAPASQARLRDRVLASGGVLLVCQRDLDQRRIDAATLVPEVVPVRGWPPAGSSELPPGRRYFLEEDPANLPASNEALRRLRSTCA